MRSFSIIFFFFLLRFHPACIDMTVEEAKRLDHFFSKLRSPIRGCPRSFHICRDVVSLLCGRVYIEEQPTHVFRIPSLMSYLSNPVGLHQNTINLHNFTVKLRQWCCRFQLRPSSLSNHKCPVCQEESTSQWPLLLLYPNRRLHVPHDPPVHPRS